MFVFFLFQLDLNKLRPENLFGAQVLERTPAALTIAYLIGIAILLAFLFASFIGNFYRPQFNFEIGLPKSVRKKLASTATNRSLRIWQTVFVLLAITVFGYHVYWTYWADEYNEQFQALSYKDLRYRRTTAANLRGWMFDRSGELEKAIAFYKKEPDGQIVRAYTLKQEMAHLLGTERGVPGLERTLYQKADDPMPETWEILTKVKEKDEGKRDVRITIDSDLQVFLRDVLKGQKGAIVVMDPQKGDILGMYSNPTFDIEKAQGIDEWLRLEGNSRDKPLVNRALGEYYVPGSTFKTFTMTAAFRAGRERSVFVATPEGFQPKGSGRPIRDYGGSCTRCGPLGINEAFQYSSNQYFSQLAISVGKKQISDLARLLGIKPVETPAEATKAGFFPDIWNTSNDKIANSIAPIQSTIVTGKTVSAYDVGLEGIGQGYAGQMTPFQMALVASVPANLQGKLMKPKIEYDRPPESYSQVVTPRQAAQMRQIMSLVPSAGTARGAFASVNAAGIKTGGKTGSAEKQAPVYDSKTGKLKTVTKKRRNKDGELVEYQSPVLYLRTDSWYVSIAPLDRPSIVIAVVVESGGGGSKTAAPIAARVVLKARELGLLSGIKGGTKK
ncbi:MAG: penicillin-binding transpeptidase domain-containing protein [Pyrinomonadaceae bacterium]